MTEEEKARKVSTIKRINERLAAIGREFGKDSSFYQRFKNAITLSIPEEARTGSGTISRSEKTLDKIPDSTLSDLASFHTVGEIKKTAREQLAQEKGVKPNRITQAEIRNYIDIMDEVNNYLSKLTKEESDFYSTYWNKAGAGAPRPSYSMLKQMKDTREEAKDLRLQGKEEEAQYIEDKLSKRIEAENEDNIGRIFS